MRMLILDDDQTRHDAFVARYPSHDRTHVYTAPVAIEALDGDKFDVVFLDHDLGEFSTVGDGYEVVQKMLVMPAEKRPTRVIVHSWNAPRALMMVEDLRKHGFDAIYKPFRN